MPEKEELLKLGVEKEKRKKGIDMLNKWLNELEKSEKFNNPEIVSDDKK